MITTKKKIQESFLPAMFTTGLRVAAALKKSWMTADKKQHKKAVHRNSKKHIKNSKKHETKLNNTNMSD